MIAVCPSRASGDVVKWSGDFIFACAACWLIGRTKGGQGSGFEMIDGMGRDTKYQAGFSIKII